VDLYDDSHGISAMMRTTGYSLSITGQMQVRREVGPPGVWTPDECVPAEAYIGELRRRGIALSESDSVTQ
jgi:lysine 6-dehydrogenase